MLRELDIGELNDLRAALDDVIGYLADNSCGDPDCCGGPYYERPDFEDGVRTLEAFGMTVNEKTVLTD
jgi:hypothetical protein